MVPIDEPVLSSGQLLLTLGNCVATDSDSVTAHNQS